MLREHLTTYRYHSQVRSEFKASRPGRRAMAEGSPSARLLEPLAGMTGDDEVLVTATWLHKETYQNNHGPNPPGTGDATRRFRNYQLRRLLEHHVGIRPFGTNVDVVIDRWPMSHEERAELVKYISDNWNLRPTPIITFADSLTSDFIQLSDVIARLLTAVVTGVASEYEQELCSRLVHSREITRGSL